MVYQTDICNKYYYGSHRPKVCPNECLYFSAEFAGISFYVFRLWKVCGVQGRRLVVLLVSALVFCNYGVEITTIYFICKMNTLEQVHKYSWIVYLTYGTCAVVDIAIAATFCWIIGAHRTGYIKSDSIINRIIVYVLGSGALTSAFDIVCLTISAAMPNNFVSIGVGFSSNNLYVNSCLALLTSRDSLKQRLPNEEAADQNIHLPHMRDLVRPVRPHPLLHDNHSDSTDCNAERATTPIALQGLEQTRSVEIKIEHEVFSRIE
ncbi:hypothetical protein NEOLEDRAFT_829321 [Neolentinus lepideus HHB14362 ss-1]|uniref:DUF6534 domain-containing protein n=1 Tax=Neolentinus lepideus HHB14362 ss-1 TaxID=1314782 RepID=A0A165P8Z1_9AGAM|nr:hypothetical protein NEOLEDRAFT_829321 [Neolentinus lepideus HHB14362 ss-1]